MIKSNKLDNQHHGNHMNTEDYKTLQPETQTVKKSKDKLKKTKQGKADNRLEEERDAWPDSTRIKKRYSQYTAVMGIRAISLMLI